jgi:DNA-binding PadR family transcriptional regulator
MGHAHHQNSDHPDHSDRREQHDGFAGGGRFGRPFARGQRPGGFGGPGFGGPGPFGGFPGFGPGGHRGGRGRARKGDVRLAVLSLLADAPSNGYGLIKAIAERTDGVWKPSPGSVYPTLQQLVDEELIVAGDEGAKGEYSLTEAGRAYVAEHADAVEAAWAATTGDEASDEFHESLGKLFGVVQQFRSGVTDAQRAAATAKLDETRRALYAILAD